jgi:PAS domain S-box-containing protein
MTEDPKPVFLHEVPEQPTGSVSPARILVVEDQIIVARDIKNRLSALGYEPVDDVPEGELAIARARELRPDLVLMDICLRGEMDGIEAAALIRRNLKIPVIFLTAYAEQATLARAKSVEPYGFIIKPVEDSDLHTSIEVALHKHKADMSRMASEERYRRLFECVTDAVFLSLASGTGGIGRIVDVNDVACKLLGWSREELLARTLVDIDAQMTASAYAGLARHLQRPSGVVYETVLKGKDGRHLPVEVSAHTFELDGEVLALSIVRDLTERKASEAALRESERRFRNMMENVHLATVMLDSQSRIVFINEFLLQILDWHLEEVIGKDWVELCIPPEDADEARSKIEFLLGGQSLGHSETELLTRTGQRRLVRWSFTSLKDGAGKIVGVASVGEDITEQRASEAALKESEERFRALVENAPDGIFVQSGETFAYVNAAAARMFQAGSAGELTGTLVLERFHPDAREQVAASLKRLTDEKASLPLVEEKCLRLDGSEFSAEVTAVPFPFRGKDGALVFFRDISDRKRLEEQFRQAQKMEAVGQLAGGVAHDFNNILAAAMMQLELMQVRPQPGPEWRQNLKDLGAHMQRAANLTRQLLLFGRRSVLEIKELDLNELVENLLKMLRRLIGENVRLEWRGESQMPMVMADTCTLEQVIVNLAVNARDAMPQGGRLTLSTDSIVVSEAQAAQMPGARAGRFVRLTVSDTGTGMTEQVMKHIFEPFFTTKAVGKGTGLGLATVYGIVNQHRGWLTVSSQLGLGSSFSVYLEAVHSVTPELREEPPKPAVRGGSETIMLVEDEPAVRQTVAMFLARWGYRVLEAADGPEAIRMWESARNQVDLLFTDMVMPEGISGLELAQRLRETKPGLRVIVASGYSSDLVYQAGERARGVLHVPKPFQPDELAMTIRRCLDEPVPMGNLISE